MITQQDIETTLRDFETYCRFVEERKPKLTPARGELGKKNCWELDRLLSHPKVFEQAKYLQITYPSINLWFHVSLAAGFFGVAADKGQGRVLVATERLQRFRELNPYARYFYLFRIFWTALDWNELYCETMDMLSHFFYIQVGMHALQDKEPGERIFVEVENFDHCYDPKQPLHRMFVGAGIVIHHLQDFGFWEYERAYINRLNSSERDINVKAITPTNLGMAMVNACLKRPLELYNPHIDQERVRYLWGENRPLIERLNLSGPKLLEKESFEQAFADIFPKGTLDVQGLDASPAKCEEFQQPNVYYFKVTLRRGLWRMIKLSEVHTLQHLHDAIQEAFDFWDDHLFAFFMDGRKWSKNAFWDKRSGDKPTADKALIGKLGLVPGENFLYLFDFGDQWQFTVKVEKAAYEIAPFKPVIVQKRGDSPEQYPDWDE